MFAEKQPTASNSRLAKTCRPFVDDLLQPAPVRYWLDFGLTLLVAYTAAPLYMLSPLDSWLRWVSFVVAIFLIYRLSMFIHEIVHLRPNQLPGFARTWNLLAGIPLLMPSFLYESHLTHHSAHHYGTERDGEYLPLGRRTVRYLLLFLLQIVIQPLYVFFRFLVGTPISFVHPRLRTWVLERASSLVINFRYRRPLPDRGWGKWDLFLEIACCLRAWALVLAVAVGPVPWTRLPALYLLACCALGLNHLRTMAAHRYRHVGEAISHDDQFLDSTNITGGLLTELLCPLGLRYHALHHLLPTIPYHALDESHRRLTQGLPPDSPYHEVTYPTYRAVIGELWRHAVDESRSRRTAGIAAASMPGTLVKRS